MPSSNVQRELKETIAQLKILSTNHDWRERKETTRANVGRNAKRQTTTLVDGFQRKLQVVVCCWLIHLCIRLVEKRSKVVSSVEQRSTTINMKKFQSTTTQQFQMKKR
ncbi:conserved hypothetical protein [Trichinella spiralis]|uniref:hypothetical protein n=1 Tax=Trichinella spiralis TaxID=6334 RepID=UPI0001EFE028|nr:conserved hypothetical protein [Trichinella spiralis]